MATVKASEICKQIPNELHGKRIPISLLDEAAHALIEWEDLAPYVCLSDAEQNEIKKDYDGQYFLQKREALRKWRKNLGDEATLYTFVNVLCEQKQVSVAEIIVDMSQKPPTCVSVFAKYLCHYYKENLPHPSDNQWPSLLRLQHFDLPPMYVDLKLHKVPINDTMAKNNLEAPNKPIEVELTDVFKMNSNRLVILFEGIAGSGKTTLSWYACKEWANGRLLQQFSLLIHVQVSDPRVQSACTLRELIPDRDKEARDEIAQAIFDRKGEGVCFLLEGLDEALGGLRELILSDLLRDKELSKLSFIITSRPDSRLLIKLQKILSLRIMITGFTSEKLNEFLDSAMQNDTDGRAELTKMFELSPRLQALCTLPINAVVVSFLVQCFKDELPVTQTGLFDLLVRHICIRHLQLHEEDPKLSIERLPQDLPSDLRKSFEKLCLLAYTASMKKKKSFSANDLRLSDFQGEVDNTLGILQIRLVKSMYGLAKNYSFPHFALQQFLAAIHLSYQKGSEQNSFIEQVMKQDPLDEILPFYAGLTHLTSERTRAILFEPLQMCLDDRAVANKLKENPTIANDPRRKSLALFKCLYECQDESFINSPEAQLKMQAKSGDPGINFRYVITFQNMWLSPLECLAVGYFVRYKSMTMCERSSLSLNFGNCSISDTSVGILTKELRRDVNYRTPGRILLLLAENKFDNRTLLLVKELLKGQSNIEGLALQKCFDSDVIDKNIFLKHIIEGLCSNSSCRHIVFGYNDINQSHIYHLVLMLRSCTQLRILGLSSCRLCSVMPLMSKAFGLSQLAGLLLNHCDINDQALESLAKGLSKNSCLISLEIFGNPDITPDGFLHFVLFFKNEISRLRQIQIDPHLYSAIYKSEVIKQINDIRRRLNCYELKIWSPQLNPTSLSMQSAQGTQHLDTLSSLNRKQQ